MYIEKLAYKNVGPLQDVRIDFPFNNNGTPKPVILVGENGTGKSTILSNIVDSFYEMAQKHFMNPISSHFRRTGRRMFFTEKQLSAHSILSKKLPQTYCWPKCRKIHPS